jgi:hypothetical protein
MSLYIGCRDNNIMYLDYIHYMPKSKSEKSEKEEKPLKERAGTRNWYDVIPKKFITSTHNPHYDKKNCHYIKIPFRAIILGNSGAGKTQTLLDIINNMQNTFEKIIICTKCKNEPLYNWLDEKLGKDGLTIVEGIQNLPSVDTFSIEVQSLVVLDDLCLESIKSQIPISEFYIRARKKGVSMIYISKSYFKIPSDSDSEEDEDDGITLKELS